MTGRSSWIKDGIYHDAKNEPVFEFRAGERYIRDGTSNTRFTGDAHQIALLLKQRSVALPATDPAESMTFAVAPAVLADAARELLRRQDDVPLRTLLGAADAELRAALGQRSWHEATSILDRLLVLACVYLRLGADMQVREVLEVLERIFELGFEESDVARGASAAWSPRLWLETAALRFLGALALRLRRWDFVREVGLWRRPGRRRLRGELDPRGHDDEEPRELAATRRSEADAEGHPRGRRRARGDAASGLRGCRWRRITAA